jgi:hypothetical protein
MAESNWRRLRQRVRLPPRFRLLVVAVLNIVFVGVVGAIFMSLIAGTTATSSIVTPYATAVFGFVAILLLIIIGFTVQDRENNESVHVGITTTMGCLCGGTLIVYGQPLIGGLLVIGSLAAFILYRILF